MEITTRKFISDKKRYFNYALYSAKSELKAEVAGSYLNWVWWILEPLCLMFVYAFIFGFVFEAREPYFTVFIYIGLTVWNFFNHNLKASIKMIKKKKTIISKIYIPKFILVESELFVNGFKMLISFGIVALLMIYYRIPVTIYSLFVIPLVLCLLGLTFGIMCILLHFGVYIEDLTNVVTILLRLIFYVTGIMFSISSRIGSQHPELSAFLEKGNPIAYIISSLRQCLLYRQVPSLSLLFVWLMVGVGLSIIGICLIYKNENSYAKVI